MIRETRANVAEKLAPAMAELAQEADGIRRRIDDLPIDSITRYLGNTEHTVQEVKEAVDQLWSWLTDICRNVQDVNGRVQELDEKLLERLPKLPSRKPPNQTGSTSAGSTQMHPMHRRPSACRSRSLNQCSHCSLLRPRK